MNDCCIFTVKLVSSAVVNSIDRSVNHNLSEEMRLNAVLYLFVQITSAHSAAGMSQEALTG